ncbi:TetR family transcriptional regulator [Paractinoplanes abujensis]|uniref:AcrR family transcriptional regulator n=1 Tax=Paractinoplanes abujensis TaxID=882441 RepID=A0A7W7G138_9ACTN|nr:TetR family transcriptional regulator [Actinoplanes abujensis]MBB4690236.1 AcrR family transcriptional regulator [Actinoplanes abujensis]GID21001.1 TetR family transcriptional regulator [Actinoplanes abujensis]
MVVPSLAQRKRQLVSDELREIALQLLARQGYDTTTVDEIAAAAGMSRRTFHRYYASKEDVVIQLLADVGDQVQAALSTRPAAEPPAVALRQSIGVAIDFCSGHHDPVKMLAVVRLILETPTLHARFLSLQADAQAGLTEVLASRLGLPPDDLFPEMAVRMALAAFDAVLQRWAGSGGSVDPQELVDRAFAVLEPALRR